MQNLPSTLDELVASGWKSRTVKDELRENLIKALRSDANSAKGDGLFPGIVGYDDTVIPEIINAILAGHDMLFLGEKGQGKSTLMRLIAESIHLALPRLCNHDLRGRPNPFRSVSVAVHAQHHGRLEAAKGFFPNPRVDHQELLRVTYGSRADNAAHRSGLLLCRPGQEQTMHARQAAACERGLQVVPLWLSPADLDVFGYEALLSVGLREGERPRALSLLPALLSANGPMTPQELLREFKRTRAHIGAIEPRLRAQRHTLALLASTMCEGFGNLTRCLMKAA